MATTTRILDANVSGTVYTVNANNIFEALDTCHSGATAPTNEVANGKLWLDTSTTPDTLKIYSDSVWNAVYTGRNVAADGTKLDGIEAGATADQTAAQIMTAIKTVDGTGSGLDADLLDGQQATAFATSAQGALASSAVQPSSSPSFNVVTANSYLGDGSSLTGVSSPVKAWVNFNSKNGMVITSSQNVSSIADWGVGRYKVNFTTPMVDTAYATIASATAWSTADEPLDISISPGLGKTVNLVGIVANRTQTGASADGTNNSVVILR